jgi:hypothetical protein
MMEMRDLVTSGPSNVWQASPGRSKALSYSEDAADGTYIAGIVHDVGEVTIPAEILNKPDKPGKLSKRWRSRMFIAVFGSREETDSWGYWPPLGGKRAMLPRINDRTYWTVRCIQDGYRFF